jgi:hypothetical protein
MIGCLISRKGRAGIPTGGGKGMEVIDIEHARLDCYFMEQINLDVCLLFTCTQ